MPLLTAALIAQSSSQPAASELHYLGLLLLLLVKNNLMLWTRDATQILFDANLPGLQCQRPHDAAGW